MDKQNQTLTGLIIGAYQDKKYLEIDLAMREAKKNIDLERFYEAEIYAQYINDVKDIYFNLIK